jgi:hypothetical protein
LTDPNECEPVPARLIYYDGDNYQQAIDNHYRQYPADEGNIFILLLPKNSKLFRKANYENRLIQNDRSTAKRPCNQIP